MSQPWIKDGKKTHLYDTLTEFFFFFIYDGNRIATASSFQRGKGTVTWMKGNESTFIKYHQDPPVHGDGSNFPSWPCHIRLTLSEILHCVCSSPATNDLWRSADRQHPDAASVFANVLEDFSRLTLLFTPSLTSVAISHIAFWLTLCDTLDTSDPKGWNCGTWWVFADTKFLTAEAAVTLSCSGLRSCSKPDKVVLHLKVSFKKCQSLKLILNFVST